MQMKQQWGTELEREAAKTIQNLKRNLNLTIVDFPGGSIPNLGMGNLPLPLRGFQVQPGPTC